MTEIRICKENQGKIEQALKDAQGRATRRTMGFAMVERAVQLAEEHPALALLPKAEQTGAMVRYQQ